MQDDSIDLAELKDRLDGDKELFYEICDVFIADFSEHLQAMRNARSSNDPVKIKEHAHTVKGALANLSMKKAAGIAMQLELAGKEGKIENTETLMSLLSEEVEYLKQIVDEVKNSEIWDQA
jgi:two-component system sensor histidine kinase/response regulator